ncbi:hypothetical protein SPBR_09224 [Sporothrix brasiliensis 5110]|uniref:Uncharacterized protein n=1 Tax=Sporothrix brasiliensis 5110 TaxID=1398154 RepID=A0A0C2JAY4_9PEZI|nr:uncharacterized protein SPBR_09224 [Sporothrix brasiliensis 5110]KIH94047.1 hypothetical protein SPBR_09224 [Sporothrix brasiliensis 5110]
MVVPSVHSQENSAIFMANFDLTSRHVLFHFMMQMHRIDKGTVEERRGVTFTGFILIEASDTKQQTPIQQILPALSDQATSNTAALPRMARDISGIHATVQTLQENVYADHRTTPAAMPASAMALSSPMAQHPGTQLGSRLSAHHILPRPPRVLTSRAGPVTTTPSRRRVTTSAPLARDTGYGAPYNGVVPRKTRLGT